MLKVKRIKLGKQIYRRFMKRLLERGGLAMSEVRIAREPAGAPQDQEEPPR
jgi:hypothetical protein